ncbi:MAG TPA: PTS sugar transporter subunit IIA [Clostridia bacterium]|nr:PTS sugar transporter subunit IIA [Clostridia bacterium]
MQLTVRDVAGLLEVSEKTIYRWIDDGKLPGYRISGQYRFNRAELLAWATASKIHISPTIYLEPENSSLVLPTLEEALQNGGVFYRVAGNDPGSCLRNVVEMLRLPEEVNREFLYQVLLARETLESTAIGDGIAIPHLRNPIVLHLGPPMIALCFLENPVNFGALDGEPVRVLFTLISPSVKTHLHLLSRLSFSLRDSRFKDLIHHQAGRDEILAGVRRVSERFDPTPAVLEVASK